MLRNNTDAHPRVQTVNRARRSPCAANSLDPMQNRCGPTAQKRATQIRSLYDPGIPKFYLSLYQPSTLTAACPTEPLTPQPLKRAKRAARTRAPFPLPSRRPLQRHTWDCVVEHLYLSLALKQNYIYMKYCTYPRRTCVSV